MKKTLTEKRQVSLDEIFETNDSLFLDSCVYCGSGFVVKSYECRDFSSFSSRLLKSENLALQNLIDILKNPKSLTIPGITKELEEYLVILDQKLSFISSLSGCRERIVHRRTGAEFRKKKTFNEHAISNKRALEELRENLGYAVQLSSLKEFSVKNPKYELLVDMIKIVDRAIGLKQDTNYVYGFHKVPDPHRSDIDERIVASLYWKSLFSSERAGLLTADCDFPRLLGVTPRILGSDVFLPFNEYFRARLVNNPFILYMRNEQGYHVSIPRDDRKFNNGFVIHKVSEKEEDKIKEQLSEIWKRFADSN